MKPQKLSYNFTITDVKGYPAATFMRQWQDLLDNVVWRESWGTVTGTTSTAAYTVYAGQAISNPPTQAEVQALDDAVVEMSQRLGALIDASRA